MRNISNSERQDGETAFPSLGTILAAMDQAREMWPRYADGAKEIDDKPVFAAQEVKRLK
jgi:hypothetical protein